MKGIVTMAKGLEGIVKLRQKLQTAAQQVAPTMGSTLNISGVDQLSFRQLDNTRSTHHAARQALSIYWMFPSRTSGAA